MYASLSEIQSLEDNITTVEDPVEYHSDGINQVQVKPKIGLTFSAALRSILRQDPDKLLIGEIRDEETARIAIRAAMTGMLVFIKPESLSQIAWATLMSVVGLCFNCFWTPYADNLDDLVAITASWW